MEEQFVTYEIANMLKNKGFDKPCFTHYYPNGTFGNYLGCLSGTENLGSMYPTSISNKNSKLFESYVSAPLWQQVIDWFETKRIFLSIEYAAPDTNKFHYRIDNYNRVYTMVSIDFDKDILNTKSKPTGNFADYSIDWYDTRRKCAEQAILAAMKLID